MSWLKKRIAEIDNPYEGADPDEIEKLAREFAARVLRSQSWVDDKDPPDVRAKLEENIRLEIEEADKDEP
jgi:Zn-dependent peptidase ImmA (M78 family)